ncbi:polysaccharide deacetylase family protein [Atopobacter phocae]|uniref:polysaccharide deacetylase family protein n=1 Tax=Atopobacter phocae TaxID=136492 RepID=UPI00047017BD|nr:polysaccharide deacetylase family protein [Atopobacter phocae]
MSSRSLHEKLRTNTSLSILFIFFAVILLGMLWSGYQTHQTIEASKTSLPTLKTRVRHLYDQTHPDFLADTSSMEQIEALEKDISKENKRLNRAWTFGYAPLKQEKQTVEKQWAQLTQTAEQAKQKQTVLDDMNKIFEQVTHPVQELQADQLIINDLSDETDITAYEKHLKNLPKDSFKIIAQQAFDQAKEQADSLFSLKAELNQYVPKDKITNDPSAEQLAQISDTFDQIKSEKIRQVYQPKMAIVFDKLFELDKDALSNNDSSDKVAALTFDDGPNDTSTIRILDTLKKYKIKGTFFMVGRMIANYPDVAKRVAEEGHLIANHTYYHPDLTTLSPDAIRKEVNDTDDLIEKISGKRTTILRPPYGAFDSKVTAAIPHKMALWNVDTEDWKSHNPAAILEQVKIQTAHQNHPVILMHDVHAESADSLESVIQYLIQQGYRFTTADKLLKYL